MSKPTKEQLYDSLRRRILAMDLEPGRPIDEVSVAGEYGLSRTPVRDVFRQLAGEGYLTLEENRGAFVSQLSYKSLRDFFQTAPSIYAWTTMLAADNRTDAQLQQLREVQAQFSEAFAAGDVNQMSYFNNQFHTVIGDMAHNPYLKPSLQRLLIDHARIAQTFYRQTGSSGRERLSTACHHHEQLIDAIADRRSEDARRIALEHWELSRNNIEVYVSPEPLQMEQLYSQ